MASSTWLWSSISMIMEDSPETQETYSEDTSTNYTVTRVPNKPWRADWQGPRKAHQVLPTLGGKETVFEASDIIRVNRWLCYQSLWGDIMGTHCRIFLINQNHSRFFFYKYSWIESNSTPALKAKLGWRLFMPRRVLQTSSTMLSIWAWMSLRLMSERGLQYWSIYTAPGTNKNHRISSYICLFLTAVIRPRLLGP